MTGRFFKAFAIIIYIQYEETAHLNARSKDIKLYYRGAWYIKKGGIINFLCPTKAGGNVVTNVDISGNEEMDRESGSGAGDRV